ncbi:MAG: hypothetical protein MJZ64_06230, partial [Paludibacteraceae bacterium]|nr:hypothetical protein [Paludibacteraceae bacterium]
MRQGLVLILLFVAQLLVAQSSPAPDWTDAHRREMVYPASTYYTGFAFAHLEKSESVETVFSRLKNSARAELVSSIVVTVNQTTERYLENQQRNQSVQTTDVFRSGTITESGIKDIPGMSIDTWHNAKTGDVMAFAYVKTADLLRKLGKRITVNTTKIEMGLATISDMVANGNKSEAKQQLTTLNTLFSDIENDQKIMLAIDATLEDEDIALSEVNELRKQYQQWQNELKNGIAVYLTCQAVTLTGNYPALTKGIKGELNPLGCSFLNDAEGADWVITISATAREYNTQTWGNATSYVAFVDASLSIHKTTT